jgi:cyanophycin synthetase
VVNIINKYLNEKLHVELSINIPQISDEYEKWAVVFIERENWLDHPKSKNLNAGLITNCTYIESILHSYRLLCELVRLPIFDIPKVIYFSKCELDAKKYTLKIELSLINFVPQSVYIILIKSSLKICKWMTQHRATQENKSKVFDFIMKKVIKPLHRVIPAGKSTIPVLRVAHDLRIPFTHLGLGVYQLGWGSMARRLDRSTCELDSAIGSRLVQNKVSTVNILRAAGLPTPFHKVFTSETDALAYAKKIGFPLVIKPCDRDRGEGVTVDISDEAYLKLAFSQAQKLSKSKQVIVERQVSGTCHRLFIANGKLLYAVKRHPMSVIGDGKKTVRQLIEDEVSNESLKPPWSRSEIKPIDDLTLQTLKKIGFTAESVPSKGMMIPLRRIESTEWGGVDEDVTKVIHPENLRVALQAAKLFGLYVAGIDIISPDISKPWHTNGSIINEVNFAPLFGGAEISRAYIPQFFAEFIKDDGKIPIEIFNTEEDALTFQREQVALGKRCFVTSKDQTIDEYGNEIIMPLKGLKQRIQALILRLDIDAIAFFESEKIPAPNND